MCLSLPTAIAHVKSPRVCEHEGGSNYQRTAGWAVSAPLECGSKRKPPQSITARAHLLCPSTRHYAAKRNRLSKLRGLRSKSYRLRQFRLSGVGNDLLSVFKTAISEWVCRENSAVAFTDRSSDRNCLQRLVRSKFLRKHLDRRHGPLSCNSCLSWFPFCPYTRHCPCVTRRSAARGHINAVAAGLTFPRLPQTVRTPGVCGPEGISYCQRSSSLSFRQRAGAIFPWSG